ncbi:DNA phosphorothioation-dependent restriction protein DptG [Periweissella ghanensis]|uniref:DNA phosphorothioation-dependent restriction protein DptG n=1 Tax=Periweissella ghanensis TaxID=467997 RepID=A0ABN8BMK0_9LACO|nr:DNA phosphorothioation-dependent restriction protein DptG [Periweissella ghanensis]MCM0601145.1 DNA phosphorothioation-dependent restriction protein DptG [Periweissella ghanensis]CAH0417941.1 hypothetical protein WGH24286_00357 [Periweissella ghanensis]
MTPAEDLIDKLKMHNKKPKYNRGWAGMVLPFGTRNPERYTFGDDFSEIIGIIVRLSLGLKAKVDNVAETFLAQILENVTIDDGITASEIATLFSIETGADKIPALLKYIPTDKFGFEEKQILGMTQAAAYIVNYASLESDTVWREFVDHEESKDIYTSIILENLPVLQSAKQDKDFITIDDDNLRKYMIQDLHVLLQNKAFFLQHIQTFFGFYYFLSLIRQTMLISQVADKEIPLYFAYDKEKVSASRMAVAKGYNLLNNETKKLLVSLNLLDYLNVLAGNNDATTYKSLSELISLNSDDLLLNLKQFNFAYAKATDRTENTPGALNEEIQKLRTWLNEDIDQATQTRFRKPFDEIERLGFVKKRGRIGRTLNLKQEMILVLTAAIVGSVPEKRLLVSKLFDEFAKRGINMDKQTRDHIVALYDEVNILEKLSDSGDAQYVKSIL